MDKVRIGVVGIGNMGSAHAMQLYNGKVKGAVLSAVCDKNEARFALVDKHMDDTVSKYTSLTAMLADDVVDGVIIATPHYDHPELGIEVLNAGLHVLVEKPIGVYTKAVEALNEAAQNSDQVFTIMYNQRTNPVYQKVREMVQSGEIGELIRVNWVITDWFRSDFYYQSGGWRATWEGEGGGVLLNQCPHQIDLIQWICGMPKRVRGFAHYGKYHDIEVEDDVTAYFEYPNGATGVFITSTGEAPGTNRLEISGDKGKLVVEKGIITFYRNRIGASEFCKTTKTGFDKPENWQCHIPIVGEETGHVGIMQSFVDAILSGKEQIAPGLEGINGLSLSNAIHLSSWTDDWVTFPINQDLFYDILQKKIAESTIIKEETSVVLDVSGSH